LDFAAPIPIAKKAGKPKQKKQDDDEGDDDAGGSGGVLRTKHEIEPAVEVVEEDIRDDEPIEPIGAVLHILDGVVVVKSAMGRPALDLDSLLCLADKTILGRVRYRLLCCINDYVLQAAI
jgi:hypothetical protein